MLWDCDKCLACSYYPGGSKWHRSLKSSAKLGGGWIVSHLDVGDGNPTLSLFVLLPEWTYISASGKVPVSTQREGLRSIFSDIILIYKDICERWTQETIEKKNRGTTISGACFFFMDMWRLNFPMGDEKKGLLMVKISILSINLVVSQLHRKRKMHM